MQPSPAAILRSVLVDLGLVVPPPPFAGAIDPGRPPPCFVSAMPDDWDTAVCIYDVPGPSWGRRMEDGKRLHHPGVHLQFRSPDYSGFGLANDVAVALDGLTPTVTYPAEDAAAHFVHSVSRKTQVLSLGEEVGKRRQQWSFNASISFEDAEPSLA